MSTFLFKTHSNNNKLKLEACLNDLKNNGRINSWEINQQDGAEILSVDTLQLSSEELKHQLRESGVDVEFSNPPHNE